MAVVLVEEYIMGLNLRSPFSETTLQANSKTLRCLALTLGNITLKCNHNGLSSAKQTNTTNDDRAE